MTEMRTGPIPVEINLHQKSRALEIKFDDGSHFTLPCEYLRVFSPSAEVRASKNRGELVAGKRNINITQITPVGSYAVQLHFDDGHDTGVYSWNTLYDLGVNQEKNWRDYLQRLQAAGLNRSAAGESPRHGPRVVRILYFATLPDELDLDLERTELPEPVKTVQDLVSWLKTRGPKWERALERSTLKITVNKQFADADTELKHGDEVALVPTPAV